MKINTKKKKYFLSMCSHLVTDGKSFEKLQTVAKRKCCDMPTHYEKRMYVKILAKKLRNKNPITGTVIYSMIPQEKFRASPKRCNCFVLTCTFYCFF